MSFVSCLTIFGAGIVDGVGLRKVSSEPKTAPVILGTMNQGHNGSSLLMAPQESTQGLPKLHIDIPSIDDYPDI